MNTNYTQSVKVPKEFWLDVKKHLENSEYKYYSCSVITIDRDWETF